MFVLNSNKIATYNLQASILGGVGIIISILSFLIGLYCQFNVWPNYNFIKLKHDFSAYDKVIQSQFYNQIFILENLTLFLATLAVLIGFFSMLKQSITGLFALVMGVFIFMLYLSFNQV